MDITITINTDNAAFEDNTSFEVYRILHGLADQIRCCGDMDNVNGQSLRDYNGNKVGKVAISAADPAVQCSKQGEKLKALYKHTIPNMVERIIEAAVEAGTDEDCGFKLDTLTETAQAAIEALFKSELELINDPAWLRLAVLAGVNSFKNKRD